jgi:GGDEF domain-containing protein
MTNKKTTAKKDLESRIRELEAKLQHRDETIERLSLDPAYGISTRAALDIRLPLLSDRARFLVFLDIDYLHDLNQKLPGKHDEANQKISRALHVRSEDVLIRARWYSGDEIVIILSGDPELFIERLKESFAREGMSATFGFSEYTGDYMADAIKAKTQVDEAKAARGVKER